MIKEFTDLNVWQEAHSLVLSIYKITESFPKSETFALTDQLKRASISISSNIAEGFGRRTPKDKIHFYYQAHGSLTKVKDQLIIAKDIGHLPPENYLSLSEKLTTIQKSFLV